MRSRIGKQWKKRCLVAAVSITGALGSLLTLSSSARAQYGGSSGSVGWMPQDRPNTSGYNPNDLDWIGLDYTISRTYAPGATGSPPSSGKIYKQGGLREGFGTLSSFGPLGDILSVTMSVSGTSEYQWLWTPTSTPRTQQPDYDHFPGPALFTLGRVSMMLMGIAYGPLAHIQGNLSVSGGGAQWMNSDSRPDSLNFVGPSQQTAGLLSRAVLSAGGGNNPSVQISPTLNATGTATPDRPDGRSTQGGRIDSGLGSDALPITLSSPYPFGLPQMGDDSNKFVYDGTVPAGILTLPLSARVIGANQDDTQWLVDNNKVGWAVHPSIDGWIPYPQKVAQGDMVCPVTNGQTGVALYQGLPDSDAGFGLKEVLLKVQGLDSQKAYIQTFFSATAINHPNPTLDFSLMFLPNWFYYYNKMFPATPAVYENGSTSHCDSDSTTDPQPYHFATVTGVYIDNDAFTSGQVIVFTPGSPYLQFDGVLFVNGIHNYLATVGHELGHKWDIEHGLVNRKYRASDSWNQGFDFDGDGILNSAEEANGLDPTETDTTNIFGGSVNGDVEVLAHIHGLANLLPNKDAWKRDWSDAGLQYAGLFIPFWGPDNPDPDFRNYWGWPSDPTSSTYFPWDHQTEVAWGGPVYLTGQHYSDPSGNAVTRVKDPFQNPYNGGVTYPGRHIP